jgi:hypothetical protein
MLNLEKLSQKPSEFLRLSGINYTAFTILLSRVESHIAAHKIAKPISKRGRKCKLSVGLQLLLTLMYLRQYACFINLGLQFGISESYCQKRYVYIRKILVKVLDLADNELLTTDKFTKLVAIDVTEQAIERPLDKQETYYSGKKNAIL